MFLFDLTPWSPHLASIHSTTTLRYSQSRRSEFPGWISNRVRVRANPKPPDIQVYDSECSQKCWQRWHVYTQLNPNWNIALLPLQSKQRGKNVPLCILFYCTCLIHSLETNNVFCKWILHLPCAAIVVWHQTTASWSQNRWASLPWVFK